MKHPWGTRGLGIVVAGAWLGGAWLSCGGGGSTTTGTHSTGSGGGSSSSGTAAAGGGGAGGGGFHLPDAGCTASSCADLGANCGPVTDPKCGGIVDCGMCPAGQSCGTGGPSKCGMGSADACAPQSCADQGATCGQIGDGCGNTISCGSCLAPKTCGGAQPNKCGCTGVCAQVPDCPANTTTTLTGKVLDPAGLHPLYNVLVYIPNNPADPGLQPFQAGITCDVCGATAAGDPLVTAYTAPDGTFTLQNVPVGTQLPLVVQLGRWRRQFKVDVTTSCGPNSVAAGTLTMPKNHNEGDIPRIGILTGGFDPMECVLRKMGVSDSEFTNPGSAGHIQLYLADQPNVPPNPFSPFDAQCPNPYGSGARINNSTPGQSALFGVTGGQPTMNQYDLVILACEGYEENNQASWAKLGAYTGAGGRVFTTDFAYNWMVNSGGPTNAAYQGVASWNPGQDPGGSPQTGILDLVSNPKGQAFKQWLEIVGVSAPGSSQVSLSPVFHNSDGVIAPTQQWLYDGASTPVHFTFNTPVGAQPASQCGRMVYSDWHADNLNFGGAYASCPFIQPGPTPYLSHGMNFPSECDTNPMTPQEAILEFMLFDLTACVQPYVPLCTPSTCGAQGIQCGPAGDGCGSLIDCGACPTGQFCGGGGPGKCGSSNSCVPSTCGAQGIQCGPAGDGCGNLLDCGNCPAGQVCGLGGPGKCGTLH